MSKFDELYAINVNDKTEKKNGLTYLSWGWAWAEFSKAFGGDATYKVYKNEQGLPYVYDPNTGYMCYVEVTAGGITHEMWLPVMDSANNAMKAEPYVKKTKYKETTVEPATMFDINKTIMRCLVKCLGMFGLGLYVYNGEDLPEAEEPTEVDKAEVDKADASDEQREVIKSKIMTYVGAWNLDADKVFMKSKIKGLDELPTKRLEGMLNWLNGLDEAKRKELM